MVGGERGLETLEKRVSKPQPPQSYMCTAFLYTVFDNQYVLYQPRKDDSEHGTLLQKQNSFPSMDGNGAPKSVNFVDVG